MTAPIRCPCCGTKMLTETHDGITLDRCPSCDALWFDASELDQTLAVAAGHAVSAEAAAPYRGLSALSCPRCRPRMMEAAGPAGLTVR